jgi:two-component system, sensor histidine kinase and response regulator
MADETTILVVDDSLVNLAVLDEILDRQEFNVLMANSGEKALVIAKQSRPKPSLVLLDIVMPGWDGYETCHRFKEDPELAKIPILFLSGLGETENKVRALKAGGVDYVSKPFQEEELLARVRTHVELGHLREGLEEEVAAKTAKIQSLLQALQVSYQKAQEASVLKTQFLRNISHEFRTPMNIILGTMDELVEDTELDEEQREMSYSVLNAGRQLLDILTNMLNFSQQFDGEMEHETVKFDLYELIADIVNNYYPAAENKKLTLEKEIDPHVPPRMHGNQKCLVEILNKLIDNAVKYTDHGGVIIRIRPEHTLSNKFCCRFEIIDSGIGIAEEKRSYLFEAFSQVDGSSTRVYGGLGMGLALAKLYVESMGGEIGVESTPGKGSNFWFTVSFDEVVD